MVNVVRPCREMKRKVGYAFITSALLLLGAKAGELSEDEIYAARLAAVERKEKAEQSRVLQDAKAWEQRAKEQAAASRARQEEALRAQEALLASEAAARAAEVRRLVDSVPEYKAKIQLLWSEVSHDPAAVQTLTSWREVKEFPVRLTVNIRALAEIARSFRRAIGFEVAVTQCETENTQVDVLLATDIAIQALKRGDAAAAIQAANGIESSSFADPRLDPLRSTLSSIRELSSRLEAEVGKHLDNATTLAAQGHCSDAVKECNIAYQVLPDPKIPKRIKEIQKDSLGL